MRTIQFNCDNEIVIKNSRFICYLIKISNKDITPYIDKIKNMHPKASHYCYGYIYNDIELCSDDGEPGGTAGMPILNVLKKENLNYVLAVVVRYFGGIKLGAGGLVRAYTKAVSETIKLAQYSFLVKGFKIRINFNYNDEKNVNYVLKDSLIVKKDYSDSINYECLIEVELLNKLNNYNTVILEELYIEKIAKW